MVSNLLKDNSDGPYREQVCCLETCFTNFATGRTHREVRCAITSQPPEVADPQTLLLKSNTGNLAIETGLHGRRNVTLGEDTAHQKFE